MNILFERFTRMKKLTFLNSQLKKQLGAAFYKYIFDVNQYNVENERDMWFGRTRMERGVQCDWCIFSSRLQTIRTLTTHKLKCDQNAQTCTIENLYPCLINTKKYKRAGYKENLRDLFFKTSGLVITREFKKELAEPVTARLLSVRAGSQPVIGETRVNEKKRWKYVRTGGFVSFDSRLGRPVVPKQTKQYKSERARESINRYRRKSK